MGRLSHISAGILCAALAAAAAEDSTRTNLGIYGGTIMSTAFDTGSGTLFAAVAGPLSLFASSDSGATWAAAFPTDSLKWMDGPDTRGWAGRGLNVWTAEGTTVCRSVEEGGTLWAFEITADGSNWNTLWDAKKMSDWRFSFQGEHGGSAYPGTGSTVAISKGGLFLGMAGAILHSTDKGSSWDHFLFPDSNEIRLQNSNSKHSIVQIVPKADLSTIFVVAAEPGAIGGAQSGGCGSLWQSSDTGASWTEVSIFDSLGSTGSKTPFPVVSISNLWMSPLSPDTLFLCNLPPSGINTPQPPASIFMSTDGGATWAKIASDPVPGPGASQGCIWYGVQFYQDADLAGTGNCRFIAGPWFSDDLGANWTKIPANTGEIGQITAVTGHIPSSDIWFGASDMGPATAKNGIDGDFALGTHGMASLTITRVAQLNEDLNRVYLATNSGLAFTTAYTDDAVANEDKWKAPYGQFPIVFDISAGVSNVAISPWDSAMLIASTGNGLWRTSNGGHAKASWTGVNFNSIPGYQSAAWVRDLEFYSPDTIFVATRADQSDNGGLLATYDAGVSWSTVSSIGNRPVNSVTVAENSSHSKVIFVGTGKGTNAKGWLFISSDGGATWDSIPGLDARNNPGRLQLPVRDVEARPGSIDTIFIACGDNTDWAVGWSFNRGDSISVPRQQFGGADISKIAINKNHPDSVYFAMRNAICLLDLSPVDTSLTFTGPNGEIIRPESPGFMMNWFVGYPGEILYDIHYDALMMATSVGAFGVKGGTAQGGLVALRPFSALVATTSLSSRIGSGAIRLSLNMPHSGTVRLDLFDLRGRILATPINSWRNAGIIEAAISTTGFASGYYLLRAQSPGSTITKQCIIGK